MGRRGPLPGSRSSAPSRAGKTTSSVPPAPAWLGELAAAEYARVVRDHPDLTAADAGLLCSYAQAFGEIATHTRHLDGDAASGIAAEGYTTKGDRGAVMNPRIRALAQARTNLLATAQALGLSPASRARSGPPPAGSPDTSADGPDAFDKEHGTDSA